MSDIPTHIPTPHKEQRSDHNDRQQNSAHRNSRRHAVLDYLVVVAVLMMVIIMIVHIIIVIVLIVIQQVAQLVDDRLHFLRHKHFRVSDHVTGFSAAFAAHHACIGDQHPDATGGDILCAGLNSTAWADVPLNKRGTLTSALKVTPEVQAITT